MIKDLIKPDSGHVVICGLTGTGKTTLAFMICRELQRRGQICLALDENRAAWSCPVTDNHEVFYANVWAYVNNPKNQCRERYEETREPFINLFIDECGEYSLRDWEKLKKFLTRGRQYGIRVFLLSQRYCLMSKTSRTQCRTFAIFAQSPSDAKELIELTRSIAFLQTSEEGFPDLHFVFKSGTEKARFYLIEFDKRRVAGSYIVNLEKIGVLENS